MEGGERIVSESFGCNVLAIGTRTILRFARKKECLIIHYTPRSPCFSRLNPGVAPFVHSPAAAAVSFAVAAGNPPWEVLPGPRLLDWTTAAYTREASYNQHEQESHGWHPIAKRLLFHILCVVNLKTFECHEIQ